MSRNRIFLPIIFVCTRQKLGFEAEDKVGEHVARMMETTNAYRLLVGKPEGRKPLGRPRRRWVDNMWMDLVEIGRGGADWIDLARDRNNWRALVNAVMDLRVL
jgi:hypothetical protein